MAEPLQIKISAIDGATQVLKQVGSQIGTLQKSIRLLTGATGLGFVIQAFGMLRNAISQNEEMSKKFEEVTSGLTEMMGTLLAPLLEIIISLWRTFGDEIMLVASFIAQAVNIMLIPFKTLYVEIQALGGVIASLMEGDIKTAVAFAKAGGNIIVHDFKEATGKMAQAWDDYQSGKIIKSKSKNKKVADDEKEIAYSSYNEFEQIQTLKQDSIDRYNKNLEEKRSIAYANQKKEEDKQAADDEKKRLKFEKDHADTLNLLGNLTTAFRIGFGSAFQQALTNGASFSKAMGALFRSMRDMVIRFIGEMIAKMLMLFLLKQALGIFGGGGAIGGILKGTIKGLTGGQTNPGQLRLIPGGRYEPVPIMAHGGEIIGRPSGGMGGGLTINVAGSLYNANETIEQIRSGLYGMRLKTGRGV